MADFRRQAAHPEGAFAAQPRKGEKVASVSCSGE
jgi:hypothetical protein